MNNSKTTTAPTYRETLLGLQGVVDLFGEKSAEMTSTQMRVFIAIARRERVTGGELGKMLNLSTANISRCITVLSANVTPRRKAEPMGLVAQEVDTDDRRVKYAVLTEKGKAFAEQLTGQF